MVDHLTRIPNITQSSWKAAKGHFSKPLQNYVLSPHPWIHWIVLNSGLSSHVKTIENKRTGHHGLRLLLIFQLLPFRWRLGGPGLEENWRLQKGPRAQTGELLHALPGPGLHLHASLKRRRPRPCQALPQTPQETLQNSRPCWPVMLIKRLACRFYSGSNSFMGPDFVQLSSWWGIRCVSSIFAFHPYHTLDEFLWKKNGFRKFPLRLW